MPGTSPNGFPTFVNSYPAPGAPGDFAGANIRASVIIGPNAFVASPGGVSVGQCAWGNPTSGIGSSYYQANSFLGFVHRDQQALITNFLGASGVGVVGGDMLTLQAQGDFWGFFTSGASAGQKVYADPVTGALSANTTGNSVTATGGAGTIASNVLTVTTAPTAGALAIGQAFVMAGVPAGTYLKSGSGTSWTLANADGTAIPNVGTATSFTAYGVQETQWFVAQPVTADASFTASLATPAAGTAFGVLTVTAIASGTLVPGQWISATGLSGTANIQILEQLTGTAGSTGTYLTNNVNYTIASTSTFAATQGKVGKISSWV